MDYQHNSIDFMKYLNINIVHEAKHKTYHVRSYVLVSMCHELEFYVCGNVCVSLCNRLDAFTSLLKTILKLISVTNHHFGSSVNLYTEQVRIVITALKKAH